MSKPKRVYLELAAKLLNESTESSQERTQNEKKRASAERKEMKTLKEEYPIIIKLRFNTPWWAIGE